MAKAELHYGFNYELIATGMDSFIRRSGRLYFGIESVFYLLDPILDEFQTVFKTEELQILSWREKILKEIDEHSIFSLDRA